MDIKEVKKFSTLQKFFIDATENVFKRDAPSRHRPTTTKLIPIRISSRNQKFLSERNFINF